MKKALLILPLLLVLLFGCQPVQMLSSSEPTQNKPVQKITTIYIEPLPFGVDSKYENSIREAMSFWEESIPSIVFKEVNSQADADIIVNWVKEFGGSTLGHTVHSNFVEIGLGDSLCLGKWHPYNYDSVLIIAEHELGHVLGAKDQYDDPAKIMYYQTKAKYEMDIEESGVIADGWSEFYPICTRRSVAAYSIEVTSTEPLDVRVVPSSQDYELFTKGQTYSAYSICSEDETKIYSHACTIAKSSGIILRNPTTFGAGPASQYKITVKEN